MTTENKGQPMIMPEVSETLTTEDKCLGIEQIANTTPWHVDKDHKSKFAVSERTVSGEWTHQTRTSPDRLQQNFRDSKETPEKVQDTRKFTDDDSNDKSSIDSSGDDDDDDEESDGDIDEDSSDDDGNSSEFSTFSGLSDLSGQQWKPKMKTSLWLQKQMNLGANPREIISQILGNAAMISENLSDLTLWRILASMLAEPPKRRKLRHINTIEDVVHLLRTSKNVMVLTGAGVSVSCGIPDFRSSDGIYSRLSKDFPTLPDPQAMFDIHYFSRDPRPFFKFAREIYPGQFKPSTCHRFIKLLEEKGKLLRNYTQNIDTLEQVTGIKNVIECHGSFATASCTKCKHKTTADTIKQDIFAQRIPMCPMCAAERAKQRKEEADENISDESFAYDKVVEMGVMKPDIVFFGEGLPETFHTSIAGDKDKCDLLIVIGSSLKVHPVALIPRSIPASVPQILINREPLPHFEFDVQLLGDSDTIVTQLCNFLGEDYPKICESATMLTESRQCKTWLEDRTGNDTDSQCSKQFSVASISSSGSPGVFCDSGFESTSSSSNNGNISNSKNITGAMHSYNSRKHCYHKRHRTTSSSSSSGRRKCDGELLDSVSKRLQLNSWSGRECPPLKLSDKSQLSANPAEIDCNRNSDLDDEIMPLDKVAAETPPPHPDVNARNSNEKRIDWSADNTLETCLPEELSNSMHFSYVRNGVYIFPGAQNYLPLLFQRNSYDRDDDVIDEDDDDDDEDEETVEYPKIESLLDRDEGDVKKYFSADEKTQDSDYISTNTTGDDGDVDDSQPPAKKKFHCPVDV